VLIYVLAINLLVYRYLLTVTIEGGLNGLTLLEPGFNFSSETGFPVLAGNEKFLEFRNFPIGKRFEIQISVFDIFRPDFDVFRPENVVGDRKL